MKLPVRKCGILRVTKKDGTKEKIKQGHTHQVRHSNHRHVRQDAVFNNLKEERRASITVHLFCLDSKVQLVFLFVVLVFF